MYARALFIVATVGCIALLMFVFARIGLEPFAHDARLVSRWSQGAATFFVESISVAQIQRDYARAPNGRWIASPHKLKVLIVPGHQPDVGGTEFVGVHERDIVVDIAEALAGFLQQNPRYEVMVARSKVAWHPTLQTYFDTHVADIEAFRRSQVAQMVENLARGSILSETDQVGHLNASSQAALQLYGINKWASEQKYDITIHLHVNDYGGRTRRHAEYSGFAVYVPERQYSNARPSAALGQAIAWRLSAYHATSTLPGESAGVVEDQELIAVGSNNSADGAALLIEYGYIYEPQFQNPSVRTLAEWDYAYQTYLGIQDFVGDPVVAAYGSRALPYDWNQVSTRLGEHGPGVYALQAALHYLGYYPALGSSFSDCPIAGEAGPCTRRAIEAYQRAHALEVTGTLGPVTRTALARDLPVY